MSPIIEGLRGLGALMVLVHHYVYSLNPEGAAALAGLHFFHTGVELFFVLTGYLFAPLVLGIRHQAPKVFLKRRVWRLYPLYLLSLLLTLLLAPNNSLQTWLANTTQTAWQLLHHLFFLQTAPWQNLQQMAYFNEVYWTLSVEVAFYALVFACLFLPAKFTPKQRFWGIGALSLVGFLTLCYGHYQPTSGRWLIYQAQLPTLLIEFWFGMAVFYFKKWGHKKRGQSQFSFLPFLLLTTAVGLLAGFYLLYPQAVENSISPRPFGWFNVGVALAFALVLAGLLLLENQQNWLNKWAHKWLEKGALHLGALSYGVYLLHSLVLGLMAGVFASEFLHVLTSALVTLVLAAGIYHWFEKPCRNYGRRG